MPLPVLAKKMKKLASMQLLNIKILLNGRGFSKFKKEYQLKNEMGQGGFGVVYRAVRLVDGLPVAVKFIERRHVKEWGKLDDERVPMEICMLAKCSKIPGVIKLLDWFNLPEGFLIVMERPTPCVDLFDFIHNQHRLGENLARFLFRQIVETAIDCAERKVLHRDIKDENVIVDLVSGETRLIDFGAATQLKKTRYQDFQGTRLYCPPEWFLHSLYLGNEATVWSLGILLYNMLNGRLPFHNDKDICTSHLLGPLPFYAKLSIEVRDLIEKCLNFDPFSRPTLDGIAKHAWMRLPTPDWQELSASTSFFSSTSRGSSFDESSASESEYVRERRNRQRESAETTNNCSTKADGSSEEDEAVELVDSDYGSPRAAAPSTKKHGGARPIQLKKVEEVVEEMGRAESGILMSNGSSTTTTNPEMSYNDDDNDAPKPAVKRKVMVAHEVVVPTPHNNYSQVMKNPNGEASKFGIRRNAKTSVLKRPSQLNAMYSNCYDAPAATPTVVSRRGTTALTSSVDDASAAYRRIPTHTRQLYAATGRASCSQMSDSLEHHC